MPLLMMTSCTVRGLNSALWSVSTRRSSPGTISPCYLFLMRIIDFYIMFIGFGLTILVQICQILHYYGSCLCISILSPVFRDIIWFPLWCIDCLCVLFKRSGVGVVPLEIHQPCFILPYCMSHSSGPSPRSQHGASDHQHQNTGVCDHAPISPPNPMVGCGSDSKCQPPSPPGPPLRRQKPSVWVVVILLRIPLLHRVLILHCQRLRFFPLRP